MRVVRALKFRGPNLRASRTSAARAMGDGQGPAGGGPFLQLVNGRRPVLGAPQNPRNSRDALATARTPRHQPVPQDLNGPESGMLLPGSCT